MPPYPFHSVLPLLLVVTFSLAPSSAPSLYPSPVCAGSRSRYFSILTWRPGGPHDRRPTGPHVKCHAAKSAVTVSDPLTHDEMTV